MIKDPGVEDSCTIHSPFPPPQPSPYTCRLWQIQTLEIILLLLGNFECLIHTPFWQKNICHKFTSASLTKIKVTSRLLKICCYSINIHTTPVQNFGQMCKWGSVNFQMLLPPCVIYRLGLSQRVYILFWSAKWVYLLRICTPVEGNVS